MIVKDDKPEKVEIIVNYGCDEGQNYYKTDSIIVSCPVTFDYIEVKVNGEVIACCEEEEEEEENE